MPEACANCRFWLATHEVQKKYAGNCVRFPPAPLESGETGLSSQWPRTMDSMWCGEYVRKDGPKE